MRHSPPQRQRRRALAVSGHIPAAAARRVGLAALVALAFGFAACSEGDSANDSISAPPTTRRSPAPAFANGQADGDRLQAFRQAHESATWFGTVWVDRRETDWTCNIRLIAGYPGDVVEDLRSHLDGELQIHLGGPSWSELATVGGALREMRPAVRYFVDTSSGVVTIYDDADIPATTRSLPYVRVEKGPPPDDQAQPAL